MTPEYKGQRESWAGVCWGRAGIVVVKESSHFKGINDSGV